MPLRCIVISGPAETGLETAFSRGHDVTIKPILVLSTMGLCLFSSIMASAPQSPRISVMIFETPPDVVTVVGGVPDEKEGILGSQVGGMVTAQFPNTHVLMNLNGPAGFVEEQSGPRLKRTSFSVAAAS